MVAPARKTNGLSLSPHVAVTSAFLTLSYIVMVVAPSKYVFATMTNTCYLAAGFWREMVSAAEHHSATLLVGQMAGGSLVLAFMGASSFAYHRESLLNTPAHTLDILFGWVLVSHALYVSASVTILALVRTLLGARADTAISIVRAVLSLIFLVLVTMLMVFYDDFYSNQNRFYFGVGPAAALFVGIGRCVLVFEGGGVSMDAVRAALAELLVSLVAILAAILSQGSLLGRSLSRETTPEAYDFYHGNWHWLLALGVGMLYSRAADTARVVQRTHRVCVCSLSGLDWAALLLTLLYSALIIAFKEANVSLIIAKGVLGTLSGCFLVHGIVTATSALLVEPDETGDVAETLMAPREGAENSKGHRPAVNVHPARHQQWRAQRRFGDVGCSLSRSTTSTNSCPSLNIAAHFF